MLYKTNYFKVLENEKFDSLEDIRKQIDKIDLRILDLISERKDLVTEVVKLKRRDQIVDKKRIESILKKLNNEAKKEACQVSLSKKSGI